MMMMIPRLMRAVIKPHLTVPYQNVWYVAKMIEMNRENSSTHTNTLTIEWKRCKSERERKWAKISSCVRSPFRGVCFVFLYILYTQIARDARFYECMTNRWVIHVRFVAVVFLLIFYSWLSCNWHDLDESRIIERWEHGSIYTYATTLQNQSLSIFVSLSRIHLHNYMLLCPHRAIHTHTHTHFVIASLKETSTST